MYILAKPNQTPVYPYSPVQLRKDNPNISFGSSMTDEQYAKWHMFPVQVTPMPMFDKKTQKIEKGDPKLVNGVWQLSWNVVEMTAEEITNMNKLITHQLNNKNKEYLASTDWYVTRKMETGVDIPDDILQKRQAARAAIV